MALSDIDRRVLYKCNGSTRVFNFCFKVFATTDIAVEVGEDNAATNTALKNGTEYTVTLNSDQETNPGGYITTTTAYAKGINLAVISSIPETQPMVLTPYDGFNPETLNDSADRAIALIQQLSEELARCIKVNSTDTMTQQELKQKLLEVADKANEYAEQAKETLETAKKLLAQIETEVQEQGDKAKAEIVQTGDTYITNITNLQTETIEKVKAEGDTQDARVVAEGDTQIARLQAATDDTLLAEGLGCAEQTWSPTETIPLNEIITLPNRMTYVCGRHHLRMSYNGLELYPGLHWDEVGVVDAKATQIQFHFTVNPGDELNAYICALGNGNVADAIAEAQAAQEAVAELSQRVVYKDKDSADGSGDGDGTTVDPSTSASVQALVRIVNTYNEAKLDKSQYETEKTEALD